MAVYDKWGFDEDGYNREGYNKMGFDREGYNKQGFNIHGFNRQGINQKTLRDRDGYDAEGFDIDGFNRDGFNKDGYDKDGYNKEGFNCEGYDCNGFNAEGYDQEGYNREGYNQDGYDREGFNGDGIDKEGYNRDGFNEEGYDREGYDKDGYNKDGYDRGGYDLEGFNSEGIDLEGFDRDGLDVEGYDRDGFNIEGIDREGYNREGFNAEGHDREGYDKTGYNKEGFNRRGYDREGFNAEGYDQQGYDRKGYNARGFDREGYNKYGVDASGYDKEGYDRWGFDKDGLDREGFDIYGYDEDGFNILGYDEEGFDRNGIHREGFAKSDFDEDGYHIFTGFNLQGYDKDGYNINGFNEDGYDRDGYDIDGYNQAGYNRNGYNVNGYDHQGFNINGFNAAGYDREGYDIDGFDRNGIDREGYNREGYDQEGYDRYGYDQNGKQKKYSVNDLKPGMTVYHVTYGAGVIKRFEKEDGQRYIVLTYPFSKEEYTYAFPGAFTNSPKIYLTIEKPEALKQKEESYSETENQREIKWYSDLVRYLRGDYLTRKLSQAEADFTPSVFSFFNSSGFLETREIGQGIEEVQDQVKNQVRALSENPYFAHIDYSATPNLYIGKKGIPGRVTDWADKKASLYYQYQMYIGNAETALKLVREIDFGAGRYMGYRDLYNALTGDKSTAAKFADERLSKIITSNQEDKRIHDIIETIQQNQYEIITQDKDENILVLGCAGSGKTMILMHRIRFMKYNDPDFDMQKIMVISPTDILGKESQELSRILEVGAIQQMTMTAFYRTVADDLLKGFFEEPNMLEKAHIDIHGLDVSLYKPERLEEILSKIVAVLELGTDTSADYRKGKTDELDSDRKLFHEVYGSYRDFQHIQSLYRKAKEEMDKYSEDDFYRVIHRCESVEDEIEKLSKELRFVELVYSMAGLEVETEEVKFTNESFVGFLSYTKQLSEFADMDELYRFVKKNDVKCDSISKFIQLLCAFERVDVESEIAENLLHRVRSELGGYTDKKVFAYIAQLRKRKYALEEMPKKAEIMRYLLTTGMTRKKKLTNKLTDQQLIAAGDDIKTFFDEMKWEKGKQSPFVDFDAYEELQAKTRRLKEFESGEHKWRFLQDIVLEEIGVSQKGGEYYINASQAFAICYLLQQISDIRNYDKHYFYIDEFQDFSNAELAFITEFMPNSVFNFFGDYQQCINPKGIAEESMLAIRSIFTKHYNVNENYRNAKTITQYVNKRFGMNMLGIGLAGEVTEKRTPTSMPLEKGDRGAIVVAEDFSGEIELPGQKIFYYEQENKIYRDAYNVIPVSLAKGLEFEKVIVITEGMTENQKYVACTRAIKELQVI